MQAIIAAGRARRPAGRAARGRVRARPDPDPDGGPGDAEKVSKDPKLLNLLYSTVKGVDLLPWYCT